MKRGGKTVAKADLPTKTCAACGRPFTWRRKWARDWEQVRFCSDKCRAAGAAFRDPVIPDGVADPGPRTTRGA